MSDADLTRLAQAAGLLIDWEDGSGTARRVSPETLRTVLTGLDFPCFTSGQCADSIDWLKQHSECRTLRILDQGETLTASTASRLLMEDGTTRDLRAGEGFAIDAVGYHELENDTGIQQIAVAPRCAWSVADATPGRRPWGTAVQIYSLREGGAFGDFGALGRFAGIAAGAGADVLAISPVHALFAADPTRYSPYSPSSREYLNPLYADPTLLGDDLAGDDSHDLIDWPGAAAARFDRLRAAYRALSGEAAELFARYAVGADERLVDHARFEALHGHFHRTTGAHGWQGWPIAFHDPRGDAVADFVTDQAGEVRFHLFLQWLAELSLGYAAEQAGGMAIGLIADIAVGLDKGGSHAWSRGDELMLGIGIGAPPDAFQAAGQNWGITSFSPFALREKGYAPFLSLLRSAMRNAGGVRIDHALGLRRLWVVPDGASPLDGAYLKMPEDDLVRLIALESQREQALVIGEDLGVVPPGLREALTERGVLGMRVLPFERDEDGFVAPEQWPARAVAMTSTHDLTPIAGWWKGRDIDWRERLSPDADREQERADRANDLNTFWKAATAADVAQGEPPSPADADDAVDAAITYTAAAPSDLLIVPAEDLFALTEAPNLPGTIDEHPNWRRRLPADAETLFGTSDTVRRIAAIEERR